MCRYLHGIIHKDCDSVDYYISSSLFKIVQCKELKKKLLNDTESITNWDDWVRNLRNFRQSATFFCETGPRPSGSVQYDSQKKRRSGNWNDGTDKFGGLSNAVITSVGRGQKILVKRKRFPFMVVDGTLERYHWIASDKSCPTSSIWTLTYVSIASYRSLKETSHCTGNANYFLENRTLFLKLQQLIEWDLIILINQNWKYEWRRRIWYGKLFLDSCCRYLFNKPHAI